MKKRHLIIAILLIISSFFAVASYGQTSTLSNTQKLQVVIALRSMEDSLGMKMFSLAQQTRHYRMKETKELVILRTHLLACRYFRSKFDEQIE